MSHLSFGWNGFRRAPYVSQVLSASARPIFKGMNHENHKHNDESYTFI